MATNTVAGSAEPTDSGVSTYMLSYFSSLQALEDKKEEYRKLASDEAVSESERAEAAAAFLDLTSQIAHLKDAHEAFMRKFVGPGIQPPSEILIQKSKDLAAGLAAELVRSQTAVAILGIVTQFVNAWSTLSGTASAAAPARAAPAAATTERGLATASAKSAGKGKTPSKGKARGKGAKADVPATTLNMLFLKSHSK